MNSTPSLAFSQILAQIKLKALLPKEEISDSIKKDFHPLTNFTKDYPKVKSKDEVA